MSHKKCTSRTNTTTIIIIKKNGSQIITTPTSKTKKYSCTAARKVITILVRSGTQIESELNKSTTQGITRVSQTFTCYQAGKTVQRARLANHTAQALQHRWWERSCALAARNRLPAVLSKHHLGCIPIRHGMRNHAPCCCLRKSIATAIAARAGV